MSSYFNHNNNSNPNRQNQSPQGAEPNANLYSTPFTSSFTQNAYDDNTYDNDVLTATKQLKFTERLLYVVLIIISLAVLAFCLYLVYPNVLGKPFKHALTFANGKVVTYNPKNEMALATKLSQAGTSAVAEEQQSPSSTSQAMVSNTTQPTPTLAPDVIAQGVFIDGLPMGGKTRQEAIATLNESENAQKHFAVTVAIGDKTWQLTSKQVPTFRNVESVVDKALAVGKSNSAFLSGTQKTPLEERASTQNALLQNPMHLESDWTYDLKPVKTFVHHIAEFVNRPPQDAQIAEFDFDTRTFTFTDDQNGVEIDEAKLLSDVQKAIETWSEKGYVTQTPNITLATVRKHDLMNRFKMISAYTTKTSGSKQRLNNIDLACKTINGYVLMPGETFSFNETVGQRTIEKGYKEAGTITKGQLVQDVGGGICQVSTTLFNAAVRADLKIDKRNNHAWPINYISIGEDAAVNWPNLDLKFTNTTSAPIFILMYYYNKHTSAEIYGLALPNGTTIDLESKVIKKMPAPEGAEYVLNEKLPYGTSEVSVNARPGFKVDTYKVYKQNGEEIKREKLYTTTYKPYQQKIEYNGQLP